MTIGPEQRNAEMRGGWIAAKFGGSKPAEPTLEQIHKRLNSENIDLRAQLEMARKATSAAQELLEAERQKFARFEAGMSGVVFTAINSATSGIREELDTEKLLRVNDASTIADLQRQLREAEGQLKAQRTAAGKPWGGGSWVNADWAEDKIAQVKAGAEAQVSEARRTELAAENAELRRTLGMVGKYLDELKELVSDPANPKGKP